MLPLEYGNPMPGSFAGHPWVTPHLGRSPAVCQLSVTGSYHISQKARMFHRLFSRADIADSIMLLAWSSGSCPAFAEIETMISTAVTGFAAAAQA